MTKIKNLIIFLFLLGLFQSCVDTFEKKHKIYGPYFVSADPGNLSPALYYDLGDGNSIVRISDVKRVGHADKTLIAETQDGFYFFNSEKDNKFFNGSDIIGDLKTHDEFIKLLDSLKITDFEFDYYLEK